MLNLYCFREIKLLIPFQKNKNIFLSNSLPEYLKKFLNLQQQIAKIQIYFYDIILVKPKIPEDKLQRCVKNAMYKMKKRQLELEESHKVRIDKK